MRSTYSLSLGEAQAQFLLPSILSVTKHGIAYNLPFGLIFMLPSVSLPSITLPSIVAEVEQGGHMRFLEFFAAKLRNTHTRCPYAQAARDFLIWCFGQSGGHRAHPCRRLDRDSGPVARATEREAASSCDPPSVRLAGDGAGHRDKSRSQCAQPGAQRADRAHIGAGGGRGAGLVGCGRHNHAGRITRPALIGLMTYSFARMGAALAMKQEDAFLQGRWLWLHRHDRCK